MNWQAQLVWDKRDMWVGVFWDTDRERTSVARDGSIWHHWQLTLYICLVPCLPLRVTMQRGWRTLGRQAKQEGGRNGHTGHVGHLSSHDGRRL